jgi:hypothetical protein
MLYRSSVGAFAFAASLFMVTGAPAFDEAKYPAWSVQWIRMDPIGQYNPQAPRNNQGAPLTPEYQKIFEANLKDQAEGGQGDDPTFICIPDGMPRAMSAIFPMEIVITEKTTYVIIEYLSQLRRIFTDGREFPADEDPSFMGYSIGKWIDTDGDGRYDEFQVETRNLKGPRTFDPSGIPLHADNMTVVKERFYADKADPNILYDEITTIDNALTRPWTVTKKYRKEPKPIFIESICSEANPHIRIGKENYMVGADGMLMPAKKDQAPPDLRHFKRTPK